MGKQSTHGLVYELMREGMRSTPREFPFKLNVELQDLRYSTLIPVSLISPNHGMIWQWRPYFFRYVQLAPSVNHHYDPS
jgi:hypothetical protein